MADYLVLETDTIKEQEVAIEALQRAVIRLSIGLICQSIGLVAIAIAVIHLR